MISNKFVHFKNLESFLERKLSADVNNTTYTVGISDEIIEGNPDISYQSIIFIKETGFIFTHGKLYDASGKSISFKSPVKLNGSDFDGSEEELVTEFWGKSREISITDGTHTSSPITINGSEDITLSLPPLIDIKVTKDSEGRVISETYPTHKELQDSIDEMKTFFVYSGDDDSDPTLDNEPAVSWDTLDKKNLHAGDYYVTTEGRIFQFGENLEGEWGWKEITDSYLYKCLEELEELKKKLDITGKWDQIPQTTVETDNIYVKGNLEKRAYLDVLCCPGYVNYGIVSDINLYLPFAYNGVWTRTKTKYFRDPIFIRSIDLSRISGKTIVLTNESDSVGMMTVVLGNSPSGTDQEVVLLPGELCILTLKTDIISEKLVFYWEASEVGKTSNWITEDWE